MSRKQRGPNPEDNSSMRKQTSTRKGFHSMFAALLSYEGVFVRVRVPLFATQDSYGLLIVAVIVLGFVLGTRQSPAGQRKRGNGFM